MGVSSCRIRRCGSGLSLRAAAQKLVTQIRNDAASHGKKFGVTGLGKCLSVALQPVFHGRRVNRNRPSDNNPDRHSPAGHGFPNAAARVIASRICRRIPDPEHTGDDIRMVCRKSRRPQIRASGVRHFGRVRRCSGKEVKDKQNANVFFMFAKAMSNHHKECTKRQRKHKLHKF